MHREGHWLGVRRPTCCAPSGSQFPSLGLSLLIVQWDHKRALLCAVSALGQALQAGRAQGGCGSPARGGPRSQLLSPYSNLRTARASAGPVFKGVCKQFSRSQGHGFITPENGSEDIFVHVSE